MELKMMPVQRDRRRLTVPPFGSHRKMNSPEKKETSLEIKSNIGWLAFAHYRALHRTTLANANPEIINLGRFIGSNSAAIGDAPSDHSRDAPVTGAFS
jgi:hypothetical protein